MKPDDSQQYFLTDVHIPFNKYKGNYQRGYGNGQIYPSSFRSEHEPTIAAIKVWLMGSLGLGRRGRGEFQGGGTAHGTRSPGQYGLLLLVQEGDESEARRQSHVDQRASEEAKRSG